MPNLSYVRLGALCVLGASVFTACLFDAAGDERPLGWNVRFLCNADRSASDRLRLVLRAGSCAGEPMYEELLEPGQSPALPPLEAGTYGFEAVALAQGATVASTCVEQKLPSSWPRITLELASDACTEPDIVPADDAGGVFGPQPIDEQRVDGGASVTPITQPDGGTSAPTNDAQPSEPEPPPAPIEDCTPERAATGACVPCTRTCGSGEVCQNDVCRPHTSSADSCTAHRYGEHSYLFCTDAITWDSARTRCRSWGFGLAVIDDANENTFVHTTAGASDVWLGANDLGISDIGVNGVDVQLTNLGLGSDVASCKKVDGPIGEGNWYWASQSTDVSNDGALCAFADASTTTCTPAMDRYMNFNAGEPDNSNCTCLGVCLPGEDCAMMLASDGTWSDRSCLRPTAFVCEASR